MNELKPCPFCGGQAKLHRWDMEMGEGWILIELFFVKCDMCKAEIGDYKSTSRYREDGTVEIIEDCKTKIIEAWNRRTSCDTD
jgi:Lar family restriction alleviation protein